MSGQRIAQPDVTYSNVPAQVKVSTGPQRALAVGYMSSTAPATSVAGSLFPNIGNDGSEKTLFGNSMLADMIGNFKKYNKQTRIDAIAIDEPSGGQQATSTLTVTGTASKAAELEIQIGSSDNTVKVVGAQGDSQTAFAKKISDAITAKASNLPVTATLSSNVVTLTANHKGADGNYIGIKIKGSVPGITIALTAMTGGAGSPDFTGVFDVIDGERYQTIIWPFFKDTDTMKDLLEPRWNVKNNVMDGVAITVSQDTHANQLSALGSLNEKTLVYLCNGVINGAAHKGGMILMEPWNIAAQFGGIRALRYTEGTVLTPYLTTNAGKDQFGGPGIGALPYFNTLMPYLDTVPQGEGYTEEEVEQIAAAGGSCLGNNPTGTDVICGEIHTTYKTDPAGNQDPTYKYLNSVDESSIAREYFWLNTRKRFAQSRLTRGAVIKGRDMANEGVVRSFLAGLYGDLSGAEYVILQAGDDYLKYFKENLIVELDLVRGQISIQAKLCYVSQAREFLGTLEYVFDIGGGN